MEVKSIVAYQGPNIHAHFPVIRYTVDLGVLEQWPTGRLGQGFIDGLLGCLPGLAQHGCSYQSPGGLVRRMTEGEGTWLGHVMEHVAIELQKMAGSDVTFGKTRAAGPDGHYDIVYEYHDEYVGREAGDLALAMIEHFLPAELKPQSDSKKNLDFGQQLHYFLRGARNRAVGPSTAALMKAAVDRAIPCTRMNADSLICLGYGRFQKRIKATLTSETRQLAVDIASDKEATNRMLRDAGLPVPRQRKVYHACDALDDKTRNGSPPQRMAGLAAEKGTIVQKGDINPVSIIRRPRESRARTRRLLPGEASPDSSRSRSFAKPLRWFAETDPDTHSAITRRDSILKPAARISCT